MKILPYENERLRAYQDKSSQELRHVLSRQIRKDVFYATLMSKAQSSINSTSKPCKYCLGAMSKQLKSCKLLYCEHHYNKAVYVLFLFDKVKYIS